MDTRPENCRFRLKDEGKPYPRSSCQGCGKTIRTGLGNSCANRASYEHNMAVSDMPENEAKAIVLSLRTALSMMEDRQLEYDFLHQLAYGKDNATKAFLTVLEME
jgi:hypothetical protein